MCSTEKTVLLTKNVKLYEWNCIESTLQNRKNCKLFDRTNQNVLTIHFPCSCLVLSINNSKWYFQHFWCSIHDCLTAVYHFLSSASFCLRNCNLFNVGLLFDLYTDFLVSLIIIFLLCNLSYCLNCRHNLTMNGTISISIIWQFMSKVVTGRFVNTTIIISAKEICKGNM